MSEKSSKYGLRQRATAYRKPIQWQVDSDYLDKLSPTEREWMLRFQEAEYGGNGHLMHEDPAEQRRLWVQQKKQQRDAMTFAKSDDNPALGGTQPSPEDALIEAMDRQSAYAKQQREDHRKMMVALRKKKRRALEKQAARRKLKRILAKQAG